MLKFEIKKIVTRSVNRLVLLVLAVALVALSALTVTSVQYETEDGRTLYGVGAARRLQEDRKEWTGYLTPDVLKKALAENAAVNASPQAQSEDINEQNKAFAKKQGFLDLTDLISQAYSPFREYDYYRVDSVTAEDLDSFYGKRTESLKIWLASGEEDFSPNEQEFLLARFQALDDRQPWYYEYCEGWKALLQDVSTCILVVALITGILVAGVFSEEFQLRADAVYFSSRYGRTKAVRAKMGAGFLVTTLVYWGSVLVYSLAVLALLGWDGAGCPPAVYGMENHIQPDPFPDLDSDAGGRLCGNAVFRYRGHGNFRENPFYRGGGCYAVCDSLCPSVSQQNPAAALDMLLFPGPAYADSRHYS